MGIILFKIKIKVDDFKKAFNFGEGVVCDPSAFHSSSSRASLAEEHFGLSKINFAALFGCTCRSFIS